MRRPLALLALFLSTPLFAAGQLNDTGITFCADDTTNTASCATVGGDSGTHPRQDAVSGRDAQAAAGTLSKIGGGEAGFDFTALNASGQPTTPTSGATPHPCVRDNVTGLVWEVKTADGGLRDQQWTYSWYDSVHYYQVLGKISGGDCKTAGRCDTEKYVADINATSLCGFTDWRMPSVSELQGVAHMGHFYPNQPIDSTYFPNTPNSKFWTGLPNANKSLSISGIFYVTDRAWLVEFGNVSSGYVGSLDFSYKYPVRLVRGGQ